jgi:hypothetical protein
MNPLHLLTTSAMGQAAGLANNLLQGLKTKEEKMAVATAFAMTARQLYREIAGAEEAAVQFYRIADQCGPFTPDPGQS